MTIESPKRCLVRYVGQVQGVGFRQTALWVARGFEVTGYVRNQPDGSVELVAEGTASEIRGLLEGIQERMAERIRHCHVNWTEGTGEFLRFEVRS